VLSFIVVFGLSKAFTNYLAGRLSDRFGRSTGDVARLGDDVRLRGRRGRADAGAPSESDEEDGVRES
jgi:hypothetical protein